MSGEDDASPARWEWGEQSILVLVFSYLCGVVSIRLKRRTDVQIGPTPPISMLTNYGIHFTRATA